MNESIFYSLSSLLYLLFHLVAFTLALLYWRRIPNVCLQVLIGAGLNILAMTMRVLMTLFWFRHFGDAVPPALINLGISIVSVTGLALYLVAIFSGRTPNPPRPPRAMAHFEDDDWDRPVAAPGSTGIQEGKP